MVFPVLLQPALQMAAVPAGAEVRYPLETGAALMFGWTALLVWASAEPVARRGVLLLTIVPVITGLALATLLGFLRGYIPLAGALPVWVMQGALVALLATAYTWASRAAAKPD